MNFNATGSTTETILFALHSHVAAQGDSIAYTFLKSDRERLTLTYRQLDERARSIAQALLQHAQPGDRALMMYPPGLEFIEAFLGCLYAGIIAVPAYPPKKNRTAERILAIAHDCQPRLLLCASEGRENLLGDFAASVSDAELIATDQIGASTSDASSFGLPLLTREHLAFLQYTSGSTAKPKGVMVSHANIAANELAIRKAFQHTCDSVLVSWLPTHHDMGLIGGVLQPLFVGFESIILSPVDFLTRPVRWLEAISEFRATTTGGPNFAYELCAKRITPEQKRNLNLSSLKNLYSGAEPVRAETLDQFSDAFADCGFRKEAFFPCYGLAETTLVVSGGPQLKPAKIITVDNKALEQHRLIDATIGQSFVGCGKVVFETQVRIVDPENFRECASDQVGEIWVHGMSVAQGYYRRPEETVATFQARLAGDDRQWLRTGDFGFLRDGELFITGRLKDLIIIRGHNIYPQDIEACVYECLELATPNSVAAVQIPYDGDSSLGVIIEATRAHYQQAKRPESIGDAEQHSQRDQFRRQMWQLKQMVNQKFDVALTYVAFVKPGDFPRTSSGKVMRSRCQQDFVQGRAEYLPLPLAALGPERGDRA